MNRDIIFYSYLTSEQKKILDGSVQRFTFRKGQVVHRHGDACVGVIFVHQGRLAFTALSEEGREITRSGRRAGRPVSFPLPACFRGWSRRAS